MPGENHSFGLDTVKLRDVTLSADAANIDIQNFSQNFALLEIWMLMRTRVAAVGSSVLVTVNNDTGANYDSATINMLNATLTGANSLAQNNWSIAVFGDSAQANACTCLRISIPGYAGTTFFKQAEQTGSQVEDTAADARVHSRALQWRSTAAINRITVTGNGGDLALGSRVILFGR